ncbi:ATP-binding protein [Candidatus Poriferisocius sp.]|uniref:ATP-binding protein n=1 Tax=Candidatus Poriferisocius sp. TaxID=3101276 RepID=UPI003B029625
MGAAKQQLGDPAPADKNQETGNPAPADKNQETGNPADLASAVFEEEAKRLAEQEAKSEVVVLPDDLLPGVGEEPMTLRQGIRVGGVSMVTVLFLLNVIDEFDRVAIAVLLPDLQDAFGVSDTVILGISSFGGVALVLGAVPLAWLADRVKRTIIVPIATAGWAVSVFLTGLVRNPFQYFWTRVLTGAGQANRLPVHSSLLTDTYPIPARARIFAFEGMGRPIGLLIGPILAGTIASIAGGDDGWRWAFFIFAIPPAVLALVALILKEPPRAANEQQAILGEKYEMPPIGSDLPVSMSTAFARLKKVKTFYFLAVGVGTLGFALVTVPSQLNLLLKDEYGYEAFQRGWVTSLVWLASLVAIPVSGYMFDGMFRKDPAKMVRSAGALIISSGLLILIALRFHQPAIMIFGISLANGCTSASFVAAAPTIGAVAPYRMRAQAFALLPVFIFLMGGFMGSIIAGAISDAHGERLALSVVAPPASIIGGLLVAYGARYIKRDISLAVNELMEEQQEMQRMSEHPDDIPVLQVRELDYSYGPVQVLFDCGLEVRRGETLALLGTNGAGKSTLLRAISGLGAPDRGAIRLNGRTITYADAELRFKQGIVQVRGGSGVFPGLTVEENLLAVMLSTKTDRAETRRRIERVYGVFGALREKRNQPAGDLSGGQQQMLAFGMGLMHEPEVLLIDELSLGLAPVVVQELLEVVEDLKAAGLTMIIVEQSLNVALSVAERAVFMEKGRVRFEGPARELAERDDLVRAVFLGAEGG